MTNPTTFDTLLADATNAVRMKIDAIELRGDEVISITIKITPTKARHIVDWRGRYAPIARAAEPLTAQAQLLGYRPSGSRQRSPSP